MELNIVIGNNSKRAANNRQRALDRKPSTNAPHPLTARCSLLTRHGFTLLELMIVISIIIILAAVALPQYQKTIMHARETVLKNDLFTMRKLIDEYSADKGKLPQSLDDLVSAGYMRAIPNDPITEKPDWNIATGEDPYSTEGGTGVTDVHSSSGETSTEGTPYSEW